MSITRRCFIQRVTSPALLSFSVLGGFQPAVRSQGVTTTSGSPVETNAPNDAALWTATPTETNSPLVNPYAGWGIWAGPRDWEGKNFTVMDNTAAFGDNAELFSWLMLDWNWSDLEPQEGTFTWNDFDTVVHYWAARNKQIVVRLWVSDDAGWNGDPGTKPIPEWLWTKGLHYVEYKGNGGAMKREPDYMNPTFQTVYLPMLQKLLSSFAARYDMNDTPVILLQVMGYGTWADWATWYTHYKFPSLQAKHALLAQIMELYIHTFKHIQLFEMAAGDWNDAQMKTLQERMYSKALDVAVSHGFGLIWTGFIDGLGNRWDRDEMEEYWRRVPILAEDNWDYLEIKDQQTHGTLDENLDVMLDWHANLAHYYVRSTTYQRAMREDRSNFERGLKSGGLGYRLVPISLSWPRDLPAGNLLVFRQNWVNRNVGRLYVRLPLKLYLTDAQGSEKFSEVDNAFDARSWVKGRVYSEVSVFHLSKTLIPGVYDVRIALADAKGRPCIQLGIESVDSTKRYKVGQIRILPPINYAACEKAYCP